MSEMYETDVMSLIDMLDAMNEEQRKILLERYCHYCYSIKLENEAGDLECLSCQEEAAFCPV